MCLKKENDDAEDPVASVAQLNKLAGAVEALSQTLDAHIGESQETLAVLSAEMAKNSQVLRDMMSSIQ